ncbi:MAG: chemotaxis protein CheW [Calditrichales bacterium]|nr:chemotaxis protein CheW [Calditrichales bacterium]
MELAKAPFNELQNTVIEFKNIKINKKSISNLRSVFRNVVLIAEYQGFDDIWKKLIEFENRIVQWQEKLPALQDMETWLQLIKDFISGKDQAPAVEAVKKTDEIEIIEETPDTAKVIEKKKAEPSEEDILEVFADYDKNLVQIFIDTLSNNLITIESLWGGINKQKNRIEYITELEKIHQAANYMDIAWIKELILNQKSIISETMNKGKKLSKSQKQLLEDGIAKLKQVAAKWDEVKNIKDPEIARDETKEDEYDFLNEDEELIKIFIDNYKGHLDQIFDIIKSLSDGFADQQLLLLLRETFSLMETSVNYMNYQELRELNQQALQSLESMTNPEELLEKHIIGAFIDILKKTAEYLKNTFKYDKDQWDKYIELQPLEEFKSDEGKLDYQAEKKASRVETEQVFDFDNIFEEGEKPSEIEEVESAEVKEEVKEIEEEEAESASKEKQAAQVEAEEAALNISRDVKQKTLRVDINKVEDLMSMVGELVVNRSSFDQLTQEFRIIADTVRYLIAADKRVDRNYKEFLMKFDAASATLGRLTNQIQEGIMRIRMMPISNLFNRFPRMVREIMREAGKEVGLELLGEDTELDKTVIEEISDPLIHIIRNSIDHGIEAEDIRLKAGKPPAGKLKISAYHEGGKINIEVSDDGQGINKKQILEMAVKEGILEKSQIKYLHDAEVYHYLFRPGFTTAKNVSSLSGRGVGLDVVKRNIERLNGAIQVTSKEGAGSSFLIQIPLTLAIIQALLVKVQAETFCLPLTSVIETLKVQSGQIETIEGHAVFYYRERVISLLYLNDVFNMENINGKSKESFIVVVSSGTNLVGIVVDKLVGQQDIVIKSLEEEMILTEGVSGAAILGGGDIALIIDVSSLINSVMEEEKKIRKHLQTMKVSTDAAG